MGSEKLYVKHVSDKRLYPWYIKNCYNSTIRQTTPPPPTKMGKRLKRHHTKLDVWVPNKHMGKVHYH